MTLSLEQVLKSLDGTATWKHTFHNQDFKYGFSRAHAQSSSDLRNQLSITMAKYYLKANAMLKLIAASVLAFLLHGCGSGGAPLAVAAPAVAPVVVAPVVAVPVDPMANTKLALQSAATGISSSLTVVGFGSSVSNGAALADAGTQAPVMYLSHQLQAKSAALRVTALNRSVDGSVVAQMQFDAPRTFGYWEAFMAEGKKPGLVVFAFGMNDGLPGAYNTGQTFPFFQRRLAEAIRLAQAAGADVVVMTTPHPISTVVWSMPAGVPQTYPVDLPANVAPEAMSPPASKSTVLKDMLGHGILIPVSERHLQVNDAARKAAAETGAALIDVERYWFEAVETRGEKLFFNESETVHPNLIGHQVSYQRGIDAFIAALLTK